LHGRPWSCFVTDFISASHTISNTFMYCTRIHLLTLLIYFFYESFMSIITPSFLIITSN
jgi:hypothetical protein